MFYFEQILFEQEEQPPLTDKDLDSIDDKDLDIQLADIDNAESENAVEDNVNQSLISIKRYYLIQKLLELNNKLIQLRINNDILNLVIKFVDSFTYDSLLKISEKIAEEIYFYVNQKKESKI